MKITEAMIDKFYEVSIDIEFGNWSDAANICVDNGFDVFTLLDIKDHVAEEGQIQMSYRDLAIISVYAERLRYEKKSSGK